MKKTSLFLLAFILSIHSSVLQGQNLLAEIEEARLKCIYDYYRQQDSLDPDHIRHERMVLLSGDNVSLYYSFGANFRDSVYISNPDIDFMSFRELDPPRSTQQIRIYKNHPVGIITTFDYVMPDMYQYEENLDLFDWTLSDETDVIHGYPVQKATTNFGGRDWIAWFTPEIPISDGPYKFRGLPGLILHIEDSRQHYVFKIQSISRPESGSQKMYLYTRSNIIKTTKQQFFEIRERFRKDVMGALISAGIPTHEDTDFDRIQDNMRRHNNPIELTAE